MFNSPWSYKFKWRVSLLLIKIRMKLAPQIPRHWPIRGWVLQKIFCIRSAINTEIYLWSPKVFPVIFRWMYIFFFLWGHKAQFIYLLFWQSFTWNDDEFDLKISLVCSNFARWPWLSDRHLMTAFLQYHINTGVSDSDINIGDSKDTAYDL